MNRYEALEFISNRLIQIDTEIMNEESTDHPLFDEKWLLLEAQSRIIYGDNPNLVLKMVLDYNGG